MGTKAPSVLPHLDWLLFWRALVSMTAGGREKTDCSYHSTLMSYKVIPLSSLLSPQKKIGGERACSEGYSYRSVLAICLSCGLPYEVLTVGVDSTFLPLGDPALERRERRSWAALCCVCVCEHVCVWEREREREKNIAYARGVGAGQITCNVSNLYVIDCLVWYGVSLCVVCVRVWG